MNNHPQKSIPRQEAWPAVILIFLIAFLLTACGAHTPAQVLATATEPVSNPAPGDTAAPTDAPGPTTAVAAVPAAAKASPTPDTRPKPEAWQTWPVTPEEIPAHLKDIYEKGQSQGNDARHFSKVGDCQSIQEALLGMFEQGKPYYLPKGEEGLQETIDAFAGSFGRDGQAVQGGFNAASVLSPLWANPDVCRPGETPLDCELRTYKPSYVIISLEISFPGRTTEAYEKYMRRIIDRALETGAIPILVTKADNVEGDNSINLVTARLAYEYDIPLVNWWLDAQGMPNKGMDPARNDGFHISMEAWRERSLQVLKTLDMTRRAVTGSSVPAAAATPTAKATLMAAPAALEVLAPPAAARQVPAQAEGTLTGQVYFGLAETAGELEKALGVYRMDAQTGAKTMLLGEGYNLQAVSPDGGRLLVNKGSELYLTAGDGSNPALLTSSFYAGGRRGAAWLDGGQALVFIAGGTGKNTLVYYPLDGSGWQKLTTAEDDPRELYRPPGAGTFVFLDGSGEVKSVAAPGLPGTVLEKVKRPAYSPDGKTLAYTVDRTGEKTGLVIAAADGQRETPIENIGDHMIDYAWSPDGQRLAVLTLMQSEYSGQWYDLRNMVITAADMGTRLLPAISGLNARAVWAPDGGNLLFTSTEERNGSYVVQVWRYDFSDGTMADLTSAAGMQSDEFLLVTNIFWP